ncbi:RNA polymerase sigma factor [Planctomycetota bacterium]
MVDAMAKIAEKADNDDLVLQARSDADALGRLYELYYERIFRFCVHRLFFKEVAEDVTSIVFLQVARKISSFRGQTEADFRNWLYAIAANHANSYIRKASRRNQLLEKTAQSISADCKDNSSQPDWTKLYSAILKLKPKYQTIVTLRFFENFSFSQIAKITNARQTTVRVGLHRAIKKLRYHLQRVVDGGR